MPTLTFTDRWIKAAAGDGQRLEYTDAITPNLRLRIGARGKTFSALVARGGRRKRIPLGSYPATSLAEARARAAQEASTTKEAVSGVDARPLGTLRELCMEKVALMRSKGQRSFAVVEHVLITAPHSAVNVIGGATPARDVSPRAVADWFRQVRESGTRTDHPLRYLSAAFSMGLRADLETSRPADAVRYDITANPVTPVPRIGHCAPRDRCLSTDELSLLWHTIGAGHKSSETMRLAFRALIAFGGLRVEEVAHLSRAQLTQRNGHTWATWAATKNGREHTLPVPLSAMAILDEAALTLRASPWVFPSPQNPEKPIETNYLRLGARRWCVRHGIERFQPRDLRRSLKTALNEARPDLEAVGAIDRWHNHGQRNDVSRRHYDRATYEGQKLEVAATVDAIVERLRSPHAQQDTKIPCRQGA